MTKPLQHQWLVGADVPNSLAQQVQENFDALAIEDDSQEGSEAWHVVGSDPLGANFAGTWTNFGGGLSVAAYYRDPFGVVHLKGQVAGGTVGTTIYGLPPGYRPSERLDVAVGTAAGDGASTVSLMTNGTIVPAVAAGNTRVSLDGVTFRP